MSFLSDNYATIFKKYSNDELVKECISFKNGGKTLNKTLCHFFKEDIYKCCGKKLKYHHMMFYKMMNI